MTIHYSDEEMERFRKTDYEHKGRWQINWDESANALKRAADHLLEIYQANSAERNSRPGLHITAEGTPGWMDVYDTELMKIYYMLMGYSIENRIKGIIIVNHPEYLTEEGLEKIDRHDIRNLLKENGITEFRAYDDVFRELEKYVTWKGRYPISKYYEKHEVIDRPIDLYTVTDLYKKLYRRSKIERRLEKIRKKCAITFRDFTSAQEEIVSFIVPNTSMKDILGQYSQYSKELIVHAMEDYVEETAEESVKPSLRLTIDRWKLGDYDEKLRDWMGRNQHKVENPDEMPDEEINPERLAAYLHKVLPDRLHNDPKYMSEIINELLREEIKSIKDVGHLIEEYPLETYIVPLDVEIGVKLRDVGIIQSLLIAKKIDEIKSVIQSWKPLPAEPIDLIDQKPFVVVGSGVASYLMKSTDNIKIHTTNSGDLEITFKELSNRIGIGLPYLRCLMKRLEIFHAYLLSKVKP
jgi:hypothetical protein